MGFREDYVCTGKKGKGMDVPLVRSYKKLILSDLPDIELQDILTVARNREQWKNVINPSYTKQ